MNKKGDSRFTGQRLVADYQSVLLTVATAEAAAHEAERSETELMQQLAGASRGMYLNPVALNDATGDYMVRASLDAHIKKVQAEQLQSMSVTQVSSVIAEDKTGYVGRRVRITSLDEGFQPFDAVWFDQRTGYRTSPFKKRSIEGVIEEIELEKNLLVIKPKRLLRVINNNLQYYLIYPINPQTIRPSVEISVL